MNGDLHGARVLASFLESSLVSKGRFVAAVVEVLPVAQVRRALDEAIALSAVKPDRTHVLDAAHLPHMNVWSYLREDLQIDAATAGTLIVVHGIESSKGFHAADPPFLRALNLQRDSLAADFPCTWVLLMSRDTRRRLQRVAPDFYDFCTEHVTIEWPEERLANQKALGPANEIAFRSLVSALSKGDLIALAGAGIGIRVGYPSWTQLLDSMATEVERIRPTAKSDLAELAHEPDLSWRAEEYRHLLGDDAFDAFIRDSLGPEEAPFDDFHEDLVRLPFRHILTTGHDAVLEKAHGSVFRTPLSRVEWSHERDVAEFFQRMGDAEYDRRIFFLHGRFSNPAAMVLTDRDFAEFYLNSPDARAKLLQLLAAQKLVTIGFSLLTMELMDLFREAKVRAGPGRPRHFALLPAQPGEDIALVRRRLNGKYGIEPVFYPWSTDHVGLHDLIRRMLAEVKPYSPRRRAPLYAQSLPRERAFQGRKEELQGLLDRVGSGKPGVVALVGIGGAGKTVLLERFLSTLTADERNLSVFDRVVRTVIGDEKKVPDALFVWSFDQDSDVDRFFRELGAYVSAPARDERRSWDVSAVAELLRGAGRVVLALDGVDSVQRLDGDIHSLGFLRDSALWLLLKVIAQGCGNALAITTSRLSLPELEPLRGAGYDEIPVGPLALPDAAALLGARGVKGTDAEREALAERLGRHALTVSLAGTMLAEFYGGDPAQASKIADPAQLQLLDQTGKLRKILDDYEALIGVEAVALLERIAAFQRGVTAGLLEAVFLGPGKESVAGPLAALTWPQLRHILDRLMKLGLVESEARYGEPVFTAHPAIKDHFYARLLGAGAERVHDAVREKLAVASMQVRPETPEELDSIEELIHHTIGAGKVEEAFDAYVNRIGGHPHLGSTLGEYARGERITREFLEDGDSSRPRRKLSELQYDVLLIDRPGFLVALGQLNESATLAKSIFARGRRTGNLLLTGFGWILLGEICLQQGHLSQARELIKKALEVLDSSLMQLMLVGLGEVQTQLGDLAGARTSLAESEKHVSPSDAAETASYNRYCAGLLIRTGELTAAIRRLQLSLSIYEQIRQLPNAADCHLTLADAHRRESDFRKAWAHLQTARDFAVKSSCQRMICEAHLFAAHICWGTHTALNAEAEVTEGIRVAERFGFGLLRIDLLNLRGEIELVCDPAAAEATALEAERLASDPACGYAWGLADALDLLGRARIARGLRGEARDPLERALALREKLTDPRVDETRQSLSAL